MSIKPVIYAMHKVSKRACAFWESEYNITKIKTGELV